MSAVGANKLVLVVDDDADIARLIEKTLLANGYRVITVASGGAALETLRRELPDVLLLDIMMPGLDGLGVLAELRRQERFQAMRIVIVSARTQLQDQSHADKMGADAYVIKPFTGKQLLKAILPPHAK